jgi:hypothetical protein
MWIDWRFVIFRPTAIIQLSRLKDGSNGPPEGDYS